MARKTNKTAHVLNLLASGTSKNNEPELPEQPSKSSLAPNISIVDNPTSANDPLAGLIKDSLDKEISMHAAQSENVPEAVVEEAVNTPINESVVTPIDEPIVTPIDEPIVTPIDGSIVAPIDESIVAPIDEPIVAPIDKPVVTPIDEPIATPIDEPVVTPAAEPALPVPESQFRYINIMELLLEERHLEFMHRFDACTCERCTLDVKALAMSNLPPKYLVTPIASIAPLTSFYRNKYNIYVVTELTKACLAIINDPRH